MDTKFQRPDVSAKLMAAALLRRPNRPITLTEPWGAFTVDPFGLNLTATVEATATPIHILVRDTSSGLTLLPQTTWPSCAAPDVADTLTAIEEFVGSGRTWRVDNRQTMPSNSLVYVEPGAEPSEAIRISANVPFEILTPLASRAADARFATLTSAGEPRDWRAEREGQYTPVEPLGCMASPPPADHDAIGVIKDRIPRKPGGKLRGFLEDTTEAGET